MPNVFTVVGPLARVLIPKGASCFVGPACRWVTGAAKTRIDAAGARIYLHLLREIDGRRGFVIAKCTPRDFPLISRLFGSVVRDVYNYRPVITSGPCVRGTILEPRSETCDDVAAEVAAGFGVPDIAQGPGSRTSIGRIQ